MKGIDLGIELLKRMADIQQGKVPKNPTTEDITIASQKLPKEEYDIFYYMTQVGNLIVNLSKQEISFINQCCRWYNAILDAVEEICRAEKTVQLNPNMNTSYLWTLENFAKDPANVEGLDITYKLVYKTFKSLLATQQFIKIILKTYKIPFMNCYCCDIAGVIKDFNVLNEKLDVLKSFVTPKTEEYFGLFHKLDLKNISLDKDMLKLTEKVAFLSKFDPLILTWCSSYEVILNNLMGFELFDNPNWKLAYLKPDGQQYGVFKYPEKTGIYEEEK